MRILRTLALLAVTLALTLTLALAPSIVVAQPASVQKRLLPLAERTMGDAVWRLPAAKDDRFVVLTIDDAPSSYTNAILDILAEEKVKATFFVHTEQINDDTRQAAMKRLVQDGHELAHHMPRDQSAADYDRDSFEELFRVDFYNAHTALSAYGKAAKPYFRPPQGWYKSALMDTTLTRFGYGKPLADLGSERRYIMASFIPWDAAAGKTDTDDPAHNRKMSDRYTDGLLKNLFPGAVVIFHDGEEDGRARRAEATLGALERFIREAKAKGYDLVPLSEGIERSGGTELR